MLISHSREWCLLNRTDGAGGSRKRIAVDAFPSRWSSRPGRSSIYRVSRTNSKPLGKTRYRWYRGYLPLRFASTDEKQRMLSIRSWLVGSLERSFDRFCARLCFRRKPMFRVPISVLIIIHADPMVVLLLHSTSLYCYLFFKNCITWICNFVYRGCVQIKFYIKICYLKVR